MDLPNHAESSLNPIILIHDTLATCQGLQLHVKANLGRSKILEYDGTVTEVHEQLFVIEVKRKRGSVERKSYQYVDILTGNVILMYFEQHTPLFPQPFIMVN